MKTYTRPSDQRKRFQEQGIPNKNSDSERREKENPSNQQELDRSLQRPGSEALVRARERTLQETMLFGGTCFLKHQTKPQIREVFFTVTQMSHDRMESDNDGT